MNFQDAFDSAPSGDGKPSGLDAFDNAKPFEPLPPGIYSARVVSGEYTRTRTKGEDCYRVTFEIVEGLKRGERVFRIWTFGPRAAWYAKQDLALFGITSSKQLLEPWPPLGCEIYCRLTVALQRGNDGKTFNDVKRFDNIRVVDSAAKPFLIDPDAGQSEGGKP